MSDNRIDIKENDIYRIDKDLLSVLLIDRSSKKNIIWVTDNYAHRCIGYQWAMRSQLQQFLAKKAVPLSQEQKSLRRNRVAEMLWDTQGTPEALLLKTAMRKDIFC